MRPSGKTLLSAGAIGIALISLLALLRPGSAHVQEGAAASGDARNTGILRSIEEEITETLDVGADPLERDPLTDERLDDSLDLAIDSEGRRADGAPLPLDCLIEPWEVIEVGSPVRAVIGTVLVERAEVVEEGQVLVQLDAEVERAALEVARARAAMTADLQTREADLSLGERRRERAQSLYDRETLSAELRDQLETEAEVARHQLEQAKEERRLARLQLAQARAVLERRNIKSPLSGVVVERMMGPGERVDEEPILRLAQIDPLRVEVILPSVLFGTVEPGMRATVVAEHHDDEVHVAEVILVDPVIDGASGTFGARLLLPNADHAIPGGLHCQVAFLEPSETP